MQKIYRFNLQIDEDYYKSIIINDAVIATIWNIKVKEIKSKLY